MRQTERNTAALAVGRAVIAAHTGAAFGDALLDAPARRGPVQRFRCRG